MFYDSSQSSGLGGLFARTLIDVPNSFLRPSTGLVEQEQGTVTTTYVFVQEELNEISHCVAYHALHPYRGDTIMSGSVEIVQDIVSHDLCS